MSADTTGVRQPIDDVVDRLNDPRVANALMVLLDNAEGLAVLAMGAEGMLRRGETIADSLGSGIRMAQEAVGATDVEGIKAQATDLLALTQTLAEAKPQLEALLSSDILREDVVQTLSVAAGAIAEGRSTAARTEPEVTSIFSLPRLLKDRDVQKGLHFLIQTARSLGRRIGS